jgi:hypothetical protein
MDRLGAVALRPVGLEPAQLVEGARQPPRTRLAARPAQPGKIGPRREQDGLPHDERTRDHPVELVLQVLDVRDPSVAVVVGVLVVQVGVLVVRPAEERRLDLQQALRQVAAGRGPPPRRELGVERRVLARRADDHDARVPPVAPHEGGEQAPVLAQVGGAHARLPDRVLLPDEDSELVGDLEEVLRGVPHAQAHGVEAERLDPPELGADLRGRRRRRDVRRLVAPVQHAAEEDRRSVEQDVVAPRLDAAAAEAEPVRLGRPVGAVQDDLRRVQRRGVGRPRSGGVDRELDLRPRRRRRDRRRACRDLGAPGVAHRHRHPAREPVAARLQVGADDRAAGGVGDDAHARRQRADRPGADQAHRVPRPAVGEGDHVMEALGEVAALQGAVPGGRRRRDLVDPQGELEPGGFTDGPGHVELERRVVADVAADGHPVDPRPAVGGHGVHPEPEPLARGAAPPRCGQPNRPAQPRHAGVALAEHRLPRAGHLGGHPRRIVGRDPPPLPINADVVRVGANAPRTVRVDDVGPLVHAGIVPGRAPLRRSSRRGHGRVAARRRRPSAIVVGRGGRSRSFLRTHRLGVPGVPAGGDRGVHRAAHGRGHRAELLRVGRRRTPALRRSRELPGAAAR